MITFACGLTSRPEELFDFICRKAATQIAQCGIKRFEDEHFKPTDRPHSYAVNRNLENDLYRLEKFMQESTMKQLGKSFIPKIQNRHICLRENGNDPVLSKVYIFGDVSAIFCQDPKFQSCVNSDDDNKELRYVIGIKDAAWFLPICAIIQKLWELKPIRISRVYSPDMYLRGKRNS